jgi:hypothetical protein
MEGQFGDEFVPNVFLHMYMIASKTRDICLRFILVGIESWRSSLKQEEGKGGQGRQAKMSVLHGREAETNRCETPGKIHARETCGHF